MTAFANANGKARSKHLGSMLNAVMAAEPRSPVLAATLFEIDSWYKGDPSVPWGYLGAEFQMGTVTLWRGLTQAMDCMCHRSQNLDKLWILTKTNGAPLQWPCGARNIRLYVERAITTGCHVMKSG